MAHPRPVVLVADDDQSLCDLLHEFLEEEGYTVVGMRTGLAALVRLEAGGIDLALLDWRLPGLTGPDICRRIRAAERADARRLPIVVTSASGHLERAAALAAGADDYLAKPFELDDLLALLARHLPSPAS
ncbi:MAG TPA: response regulator [Chloroflexota bacterium]|nr:response regulator [Chloroflexota bacterium]